MERLDKLLCADGAVTRSQARAMIKAGRVAVNGAVCTDGAAKFDPSSSAVTLDGRPVGTDERIVALLNKPAGYVTATEDAHEKTVMELLPQALRRRGLKPVGRLDKETEGLLLLTNDGALLHRLISPNRCVEKVYYARHDGTAAAADVEAFAAGLTLADGTHCRSAVLTPLGAGESLVRVTEGKYHQVRRMLAARGLPVTYLERRQEGAITLGALPRGAVRCLTPEEIALLSGEAPL